MPGLNFNEWPVWLVAILVVINIFKQPLGAILPDWLKFRADRNADREEHKQAIEEALINSRLQANANEQLRAQLTEKQLFTLFEKMLSRVLEDFKNDLVQLKTGQSKQLETLTAIHAESKRISEFARGININISELVGEFRKANRGGEN